MKARPPRSFFNTNVLVYSDDPRDPAKQATAIDLVLDHLRQRTGVVSLQVLQEYFVSATGKLKLNAELAKRRVEFFARFHVVEPNVGDILAAIDLHRLHGISLWDALIVRAASKSGCQVLLTEDMQHGQVFDGVRIVNPFL
jgi:predicted nucleic acid-binding protein